MHSISHARRNSLLLGQLKPKSDAYLKPERPLAVLEKSRLKSSRRAGTLRGRGNIRSSFDQKSCDGCHPVGAMPGWSLAIPVGRW